MHRLSVGPFKIGFRGLQNVFCGNRLVIAYSSAHHLAGEFLGQSRGSQIFKKAARTQLSLLNSLFQKFNFRLECRQEPIQMSNQLPAGVNDGQYQDIIIPLGADNHMLFDAMS
jgi:hypothetical protein